jgi:CheY-like chemotaxis protein
VSAFRLARAHSHSKRKTSGRPKRPSPTPPDHPELLGLAHDLSGVGLSTFLNAELLDLELERLEAEGAHISRPIRALITRCRRTAMGAKALSDLSRQLVSRLRGDAPGPARAPFLLSALADSVASVLEAGAIQRGLALRFDPVRSIPLVGDYPAAWRILFNLVDNAIHYTERGEVEVNVGYAEDIGICFDVRDTGPGIDSPRVSPGGLGIGLTVVRQQVERLGGSLQFDSAQGRGTRVQVQLPFARAQARAARALEGKRILFFDDDPWRRSFAVHWLQRLGAFVVSAATSNERSVRRLRKLPCDVVLLRWNAADSDPLTASVERLAAELSVPVRVLTDAPDEVNKMLRRARALPTIETMLDAADHLLDRWVKTLLSPVR